MSTSPAATARSSLLGSGIARPTGCKDTWWSHTERRRSIGWPSDCCSRRGMASDNDAATQPRAAAGGTARVFIRVRARGAARCVDQFLDVAQT